MVKVRGEQVSQNVQGDVPASLRKPRKLRRPWRNKVRKKARKEAKRMENERLRNVLQSVDHEANQASQESSSHKIRKKKKKRRVNYEDPEAISEEKTFVDGESYRGRIKKIGSWSFQVHSYDLVAMNPLVVACDMAHLPLEASFADIVVFCLSLMGSNLLDYIKEARRVLKTGGILKIAEVASRFCECQIVLRCFM
ncbi:hypothetical protein KIN20_005608 [Parelaphostrongylus tenuis]|uniref:Ribosomal RNA-processing protein 8 n=1 Tax=Parelaphostrongylus tenuis TaxID=148309 RepID=A0AAD5QHM9_PARTN|nr:hypothetical protein KIN20_005608 [Parelaphostrongylus tenuis]